MARLALCIIEESWRAGADRPSRRLLLPLDFPDRRATARRRAAAGRRAGAGAVGQTAGGALEITVGERLDLEILDWVYIFLRHCYLL